jgi:hypothetical protein
LSVLPKAAPSQTRADVPRPPEAGCMRRAEAGSVKVIEDPDGSVLVGAHRWVAGREGTWCWPWPSTCASPPNRNGWSRATSQRARGAGREVRRPGVGRGRSFLAFEHGVGVGPRCWVGPCSKDQAGTIRLVGGDVFLLPAGMLLLMMLPVAVTVDLDMRRLPWGECRRRIHG